MTPQTELVPAYSGSVNTWECDENDHLNVRFYAHKINQALQAWAADLTGDPAMTTRVLPAIASQHIRFLREARAATPVRVECGPIARSGERLTVVAIMRHNATDEALAAFQTVLDTRGWPAPFTELPLAAAPDFALPRGIGSNDLRVPPASRTAALSAGYRIVGRGVIGTDECAADGTLLPHGYIGRVSDGMPNLWVFMNTQTDQAAHENGAMGGAALEYRLELHEALRAGDIYTHLSGVRAIGAKTQTMAHVVINERTGRAASSAVAIGVAMDLVTRKSVAIPQARRARLEALLLKD
jgi:acyl-CoA thioester hydrolase